MALCVLLRLLTLVSGDAMEPSTVDALHFVVIHFSAVGLAIWATCTGSPTSGGLK
jgi:hypothetical protein